MSATIEQSELEGLSPEEKLRGRAQSEIEVPGAQREESTEVKQEVNPNTE